jgi:GTP pyrophosphokinase
MDAEVISTGLLREVVDAGLVSYALVEESLGGNIARLLRDCSRVRHIPSRVETLDDDSATALRQFCLAFHDIRAVVVELASQLDIMQHIHSIPRYRQQILALETMQIYAPLAHAIGTGPMALELEDLGFRVLFPDSYTYIENWLRSHWEDGSGVVDEAKGLLAAKLEEDGQLQHLVSSLTVSGRYKSRFSTMRKLLKDGRKPEEVYDVLGLRVILDPKVDGDPLKQRENGVRACYRAMEVATSLWREVPGRLKDYIANRKENGYESLHLAVHLSAENENRPPMEIQIRTEDMHAAAVSGEASHSLYKGGLNDSEQVCFW